MTTIKKNGNAIVPNLYECKAMSIFVDGNGMALQNSVTYTPNTGSNSCMPERVVTVTPNVKYYIECTLTWNGFTKTNSGGTFDMWFQGTQNDGWTTGNPITGALNDIKRPRDVVLSKTTGVYTYKATFTSTSTSITKFGISMRSDYSNGTAWVTLSDILIVPEKYYIDLLSSNSVKTKFHNTYISCNEIIEN